MVLGFSSYFFSFPPLNFNFCNKRYVCWSFPPRPQHRGLSQPEPRARRRPDLSLPPAAAGALARHHTGGPAAPPPPPVGDFSLPLPTTSPLPMAAVDPLEGRTITRQVSTATPTRSQAPMPIDHCLLAGVSTIHAFLLFSPVLARVS